MKKSVFALFGEIWKFIKADFHALSYIYTFVFIGVAIFLNYELGFYRTVMRNSYFEGNSMLYFPLFYLFFYFAVAIPTLFFRKEYKKLNNSKFYAKSLFFILLYGLSIGFYAHKNIQISSFFHEENAYIIRLLSQLKSILFYFVPLYIFKHLYDKKIEGIYGLTPKTSLLRGYFSLYLMLLPFIILISFSADFQTAYPQFKPWYYEEIFGLPTAAYTFLFEISYGLDFIMTELLFRGALVIGMTALLGRSAVLPMVAMYCAIHFGKPLGEIISSVFGGYILGALAYQTRHIWGGVIVHILIALSMEIMALFHFYSKEF